MCTGGASWPFRDILFVLFIVNKVGSGEDASHHYPFKPHGSSPLSPASLTAAGGISFDELLKCAVGGESLEEERPVRRQELAPPELATRSRRRRRELHRGDICLKPPTAD